jgi:hypothetical protein
MSSHASAGDTVVDFGRDVPTSGEDVAVLARLRRDTPSWFSLSAGQLDDARPFTLP